MARRNKPQDAREQRRRDFEAVGLQREAADLRQNGNIEVTRTAEDREGKTVDHDVAVRRDAFDALKASMNQEPRFHGCYDAARRFERDVLLARCEADTGRSMERVDDAPKGEFRFILAASNVAWLKKALSRRDFWLLYELIAPSQEYEGGWRGAVAYVTGEDNPNAQGAAVRGACANLRDAYEAMDEKGRKAA